MGGGETGTGGAPPKHPEGLGVPAALPRLLVHGAAVLVPDGAPGGGEGSAKDPLPAPKTRARLQPALTSGCSWWGRAGKRRPRRGISRWARRRRPPSPRWGSAARTAARPCSGRKPRTDPPPGGAWRAQGGVRDLGTGLVLVSPVSPCPHVPVLTDPKQVSVPFWGWHSGWHGRHRVPLVCSRMALRGDSSEDAGGRGG